MKNKFLALSVIFALLLCGCNGASSEKEQNTAYQTTESEAASTDLSASAENTPVDISKQLTENEYGKMLAEYWNEYKDSARVIDTLEEQADNDFDKLKEINGEILEAHDNIKAVLDKFSALIPPDEYRELHQRLIEGADKEKRWLELQKSAYCADTEEEANEICDKIVEEMDSTPINDLFPSVYVKIRLKLQDIE